MAPKLNRPDPPYMQIVNHFRAKILAGELREGDKVPTGRQIAQDWNVAIATATKVITTLSSEGLVNATPGKGTVVALRAAEGLAPAPLDRIRSIRQGGRIYPANAYAKIISAEVVTAPEHVADALGIAHEAQVIRRHRVTYQDDDLPVSASTSWFNSTLADRAPQLLIQERIIKGTMGYIEDVTGRTLQAGRDQLAATAATPQAAEDLGVLVGSPVLARWLVVYDSDGNVVEFGESVMRPDRRVSYDYEIN